MKHKALRSKLLVLMVSMGGTMEHKFVDGKDVYEFKFKQDGFDMNGWVETQSTVRHEGQYHINALADGKHVESLGGFFNCGTFYLIDIIKDAIEELKEIVSEG